MAAAGRMGPGIGSAPHLKGEFMPGSILRGWPGGGKPLLAKSPWPCPVFRLDHPWPCPIYKPHCSAGVWRSPFNVCCTIACCWKIHVIFWFNCRIIHFWALQIHCCKYVANSKRLHCKWCQSQTDFMGGILGLASHCPGLPKTFKNPPIVVGLPKTFKNAILQDAAHWIQCLSCAKSIEFARLLMLRAGGLQKLIALKTIKTRPPSVPFLFHASRNLTAKFSWPNWDPFLWIQSSFRFCKKITT